MKLLFSLLSAVLCISNITAQQKLIAIKGAATDAITTTLNDAIAIAQPGDKIYLPGGNFEYTGSLEKPVHIIGIGFQNGLHVDGNTIINGDFILNSEGSNSIFEGFYLSGYFRCGTQVTANNIVIKKCNFNGIAGSGNFDFSWTNCQITNCVARENLRFNFSPYWAGGYLNNSVISNSFIYTVFGLQNSIIKNCIVGSNFSINSCINLTLKNCIFSYYSGSGVGGTVTTSSANLTFNNNVFYSGNSSTLGDGVLSNLSPLYYSSSATEVFVNAADFTFNPTFDFQLLPTFEGNNSGDDGTDIGIYGGQYPWKNGSLPISPNIEQNSSFLDVQNEQFKLRVKVVPQTN
ncbi:right-handed parallel beta-helix repeat-containing protein [Flavobacterium sp.]|uniref:right-handed parallel beta-helix repeat-containing protein n=1 Tax=Flavobacterium sp. TaxID=239 RepID=UPI00261971B6|nr:right-handed parallel beta-helix repeat-containing protein [Flavobacterium sp.]